MSRLDELAEEYSSRYGHLSDRVIAESGYLAGFRAAREELERYVWSTHVGGKEYEPDLKVMEVWGEEE